jgi:hypothetical protein
MSTIYGEGYVADLDKIRREQIEAAERLVIAGLPPELVSLKPQHMTKDSRDCPPSCAACAAETQSPPEGGEGLANQKATSKGYPCKQGDYATLRDALQQIADMDPKGIRADDLGLAARIARDALGVEGAQK